MKRVPLRLPDDFADMFIEQCDDASVFPAHRVQAMHRVIARHDLWGEVEREDKQVEAEAELRLKSGQSKGGQSSTKQGQGAPMVKT